MKLIIEDDEGRKTVIPVVRDEITIGRNEANLVRLTEKNVSRRHGRLIREQDHYYVEDLDSFTGIRVNGQKIKGKHLVREGDLIQISEYDLTLQAGPDEKKDAGPDEDDEPTHVRKQPKSAAPATQPADEAQKRRMAETATIRLSDLRAPPGEGPAQGVPEAQRPKLVGISGAWRGKEVVLDRTPIRIGRSGENDVEIDHPSISRKQCRLHLEGGTWKVMDAESRNGVRVNGEPYASIGLRHGDVLEIGHLRFSFVEAGKPFKMPPLLTPVGVAPVEARGRTALYAGIGFAAVVVVAVGTAALLFARQRGAASEDDGVEVVQGSKAERKFALRAAGEAAAAHRYTEALRHLEAARRAGATAAELKDYNAVQDEARSEELFREMESAASSQDWEHARKLLDVLTATTTHYGQKAAEKAEAINAGYVNSHLAAASTAPPAARAAAPASRAAAPKQAADENQARQLVNDGNQKLIAQDFPGALSLFQKALALKPSKPVLAMIYRSMGIAYTRQGNIEEGARYYRLYLPLCSDPAEKAQLQKVLDDYDARRR